MTPKFRIYDKQEEKYCEDHDSNWLLSRNGMIYNRELDEWYCWIGRFEVEMSNSIKGRMNSAEFHVGDVVSINSVDFYKVVLIDGIILIDGYDNGDYYSGYDPTQTNWDLFKIIGTIHDEKYKNI